MIFLVKISLVLVIMETGIHCLNFIPQNRAIKDLQVQTKNGLVQGQFSNSNYFAFRGIPYARPPIQNLRFRAPKLAGNWTGILDATEEGSDCVGFYIGAADNYLQGNEDCLYLNVYSPKSPNTIKPLLPVMVWIHGGGYLQGAGGISIFGPEYLIEENVVVVTINYRLGLFGFLSTGDMEAAGNWGLKDQTAALRWVQTNIRNFGGNPNDVTLFGESAGASSALLQMQSPKSRGLFKRVIAQSGSSLCPWALHRNPLEMAYYLGLNVGITTKNTKELVRQLRKVEQKKLMNGLEQTALWGLLQDMQRGFPYSPVMEPPHKQAFITERSYELLASGKFEKVPLLMGVNSKEMIFFYKLIARLRGLFTLYDLSPGLLALPSMNIQSPTQKGKVGQKLINHYFKSNTFNGATDDEFLSFFSDDQFLKPIHKTAELISKHSPVHFYHFTYEGEAGLKSLDPNVTDVSKRIVKGVSHTEELIYLWKRSDVLVVNESDKLTLRRMVKMWTNFAKFGNPTPTTNDQILQNIRWPTSNPSNNMTYLEIGNELSVKQNFKHKDMQFWEDLYRDYAQRPYDTY